MRRCSRWPRPADGRRRTAPPRHAVAHCEFGPCWAVGGEGSMKKLDAIDLALLDALQRDGRLSIVALAKTVGLSATPCAERVRALETTGAIGGYAATLDAAQLGLGLLVF